MFLYQIIKVKNEKYITNNFSGQTKNHSFSNFAYLFNFFVKNYFPFFFLSFNLDF